MPKCISCKHFLTPEREITISRLNPDIKLTFHCEKERFRMSQGRKEYIKYMLNDRNSTPIGEDCEEYEERYG